MNECVCVQRMAVGSIMVMICGLCVCMSTIIKWSLVMIMSCKLSQRFDLWGALTDSTVIMISVCVCV